MAGKAGCGAQILGVAIAAGRAAVVDAAPAFVCNARVRTCVPGEPIVRSVARGTIRTEHACVEYRVTVTTHAGGG